MQTFSQLNFGLKTLIGSFLLASSCASFSQVYNIPQKMRDGYTTLDDHLKKQQSNNSGRVFGGAEEITTYKKSKEKAPYFTRDEIRTLDLFLQAENYTKFYDYLNTLYVEDQGMIKYLLSKSSEGHIPTYWLLANLYSLANDFPNTHKWLYIALIMTQQDAELCTDASARVAPKTLIRDFNNVVDVTNRSPQFIVSGMKDAAYFIRSLNQRTRPDWVCSYGTSNMATDAHITIPPTFWNKVRAEKMAEIISRYDLK